MKSLSLAAPGTVAGILALAAPASPAHAERTLDLTSVPTAITQPGTYVARRDWQLDWGDAPTAIAVTADDVVIDLRGFKLTGAGRGILLKIKGNNVTVRGGRLSTGADAGSYAIRSSGAQTRVEDMNIYSLDGLPLAGRGAVVRNSEIHAKFYSVSAGAEAIVEGNTLDAANFALRLDGDGSVAVHNQIVGGSNAVEVHGNQNLLSDNVITAQGGIDTGIVVDGSYNTLARNTMLRQYNTLISVNGMANTIEGTIAPPTPAIEAPSPRGIMFLASGNFFGNNRLSASVPYETNGTQQTDWGGNVGY
ncbi:MAG TPA: hypothetical protein VFX89_21600 [Gammaproteobacteria bacterium]|nr:hypothetical protein [Gammaproteobacteria bacterium]